MGAVESKEGTLLMRARVVTLALEYANDVERAYRYVGGDPSSANVNESVTVQRNIKYGQDHE